MTIVAIFAVSWPAPVSITSVSPAPRPVVLVSRTAVAPAAAAGFSVVFVVAPRVMFPALSTAR